MEVKTDIPNFRLQHPGVRNDHLEAQEAQGGTQEATRAPRDAQKALQKAIPNFPQSSNSSIFQIFRNPDSFQSFKISKIAVGMGWCGWDVAV